MKTKKFIFIHCKIAINTFLNHANVTACPGETVTLQNTLTVFPSEGQTFSGPFDILIG